MSGGILQSGLQSHHKQNSFGPLAGGAMNRNKVHTQPQASGILSGTSPKLQNFNSQNRTKYSELHGNWNKLKCQDPNHGRYYYSVCDMNLEDIRKPKTDIFVPEERYLWAEQEKEDYNKYEPVSYQQQQQPLQRQQNIIGIDDDDDDDDDEQIENINNNKVIEQEPIFERQTTLWSQVILSSESQYTYDSTASCTIMALECAMQLQLEHKNYVSSIIPDQKKITQILKIASMYKSDVHTDVDDVMSSITRYKNNLQRERFHQILVPKWNELSQFVVQIGKEFKSEISCVVTKPPETIFIHFHFPLLGANESNFAMIQPLIFDSHTRTERDLHGAHMLRFEDIESFENYLKELWQKVDMGPNPNLHQNQVNTVNIDVITLNPNLRDKPKLNYQSLQREFNALAAKMKQRYNHNINVYNNNNNNNNNNNMNISSYEHNQYNKPAMNAMNDNRIKNISTFVPGKNIHDYNNNAPSSNNAEYEELLREKQEKIKEQKHKIQQLQSFAEKSKSFIKTKSMEVQTEKRKTQNLQNENQQLIQDKQNLENENSKLMQDKHQLSDQYNALAQQLAQNMQSDDMKEQVTKLQKNREYLIKQLQENKNKMDELRSNLDIEKTQWKSKETAVFNENFQKMRDSKDAQIAKMKTDKDKEIASLKKQINDLLLELTPFREEKKRLEELNRTYNCCICFVDYKVQEDCFLMDCGHMINRECAIATFKVDICNNKILPRCPQCLASNNTTLITQQQLEWVLDETTLRHYMQLSLQQGLQGLVGVQGAGNIFQCPTPNCTFLAEIPGDLERFPCNSCGHAYCTKCKRAYHHNETCEEYKERKCKEELMNEQQLAKLAKKNGWKKCPKCGTYIERTYGCFHMKCGNPSCKAEYCDMCGKELDPQKWQSHFNPPNKCQLWRNAKDLLNAQDDQKQN